jgi:hypothetical protein
MEVCGQQFTAQLLERIGCLVRERPQLSKRALSRQVCEWLDWRRSDGRLKDTQCRVALQRLQHHGVLSLARADVGLGAGAPDDRAQDEVLAIAPLACELSALGPVEVVLVGSRHSLAHRQWRALMRRYHYLGGGGGAGAQLRYLIVSEHHGLLGALGFSSAAWRLADRDGYIGWSERARAVNLAAVVNNSRLLIAPQVRVKHLASHALGLCLRRLAKDWAARYAVQPLLVESFVECARFRGTCYRASNWVHVGHTRGRGRQDRQRRSRLAIKDIYLYPLCARWRQRLCLEPAQPLAAPAPGRYADWAEHECARAQLGDARLTERLIGLARDFYGKPQAQIPQLCGSRAKTKAAYRFFSHPACTMEAILASHYEASAERAATQPVVLAVQDTTSLNYSAQPAIENLGPIGTRLEGGPVGLMVHDTMLFTPAGVALGLMDVQCWARKPEEFGKRHKRKALAIEHKESVKWLKSVQTAARLQTRLANTTVVSVGDREADIFELFDRASRLAHAPKLLIRAETNRRLAQEQAKLWEHLQGCEIAGQVQLHLPRRHQRVARSARLALRFARVELTPPQRNAKLKPVAVWAVLARECDPAPGIEPIEWMLLTTCAVDSFEQAREKLAWYTQRWGIEVYHRTLKSGCRIEQRQLGTADRIEACLAIDMVVAWRILHLAKLGREHPDVPCTVYFQDHEWKALWCFVHRSHQLPAKPLGLREAMRMVAGLGGFLGRKGDGEPGTQTLWLGLQRLDDIAIAYQLFLIAHPPPPPAAPSTPTCG